jgi:hypothetical protein
MIETVNLQQEHSRCIAMVRRIEAAMESARAQAQAASANLAPLQQALGDTLAALALGERPDRNPEELRESIRAQVEGLEDARLLLVGLSRRHLAAQGRVKETADRINERTSVARRAREKEMESEVLSIPRSMGEIQRFSAFEQIGKRYGVHTAKVRQLWEAR